jgi:hypothetical protein
MADTWSVDRVGGSFGDVQTGALINGSVIPIEPGASFRDTVVTMARDAGFGKFRAFLNGEEVKPNMAPEVINAGDRLELRPYDVAGC